MSKKLHNSLLDYLVVAGCDQDTGLVLKNGVKDENLSIEEYAFEPSILAVLSFDIANYPNCKIKFNQNYPPIDHRIQESVKKSFFVL